MKSLLKLTLLLLFAFSMIANDNSFGQNNLQSVGDVSVKKWKDDKTAAFSFTFDDCMQSQYDHVYPILGQYGFKGTFYVITAPLDDPYGPYWLYGTWPEFIEMSNAGHEIGSHTIHHLHLWDLAVGDTLTDSTLIYELYRSKKRIEQEIPDKECITMAYPYSEYDSDVIYYTGQYYESARATSHDPVDSSLYGSDWYKIGSRVIEFDQPRNSPSDDLDELQEFFNYVTSAMNQGKWGLLQAHDVVPFDSIKIVDSLGSYQPISIQWFESACQFISDAEQSGDLWVAPVRDIMRYMKERECYEYNVVSVTDTLIVINVTDTLNDDIYHFPLTADIVVPDTWSTVSVFQNGFYEYTSSFSSGNNTVIETSVIPDGGDIILYNGVISGIVNVADSPHEFRLYQNYPNPFNPITTISYTIPSGGDVMVRIYNSLGETVKTLYQDYADKGNHKISFNAADLPSGVYYYRLSSGRYSAVKKMILLK
jgi:peptidoglycan/xylan/chitin deacetylase (PgdA/CDA1 family)